MANICATEDGYQRKTQMHWFMVLICGAFVYMCILIMVLFHNSSTEQPLKESQIVDFKPDISPTVYSAGFLLEPNSSKESGDKSTNTNISSKENGLSNERIVISSSNYKHQDNRTSMTRSGKNVNGINHIHSFFCTLPNVVECLLMLPCLKSAKI